MSEPVIRLVAFASIFATMALLEIAVPRLNRPDMKGELKTRRWFTNFAMVVLSSVALRLVFPAAAVGTALWAQQAGYGLFNTVSAPWLLAAAFSFAILDFAVWLEHLASHKVPVFWRIHRMHHSDNGFDLTTALRFHPLEIVLSMIWKAAVIVALGAPPESVLVFEIVLNGMAMFNHANVRIPSGLDKTLRLLLVTPDMHRVHHSAVQEETDSNYGFNLSVWDRLFSTYVVAPKSGFPDMTIGLAEFKTAPTSSLAWSLMLPFKGRIRKS